MLLNSLSQQWVLKVLKGDGSLVDSIKTLSYLLSNLRSQHEGRGEATGISRKRQLWSRKIQAKQISLRQACHLSPFGPHKPYYHQYYGCMTCIVWMSNINCPSVTSSERGTLDVVQPVFEFQLCDSLALQSRENCFTLQCCTFSSVKQWQYSLSWRVVKLRGKL